MKVQFSVVIPGNSSFFGQFVYKWFENRTFVFRLLSSGYCLPVIVFRLLSSGYFLRIQRTQTNENNEALPDIKMAGPIRVKWAALIAKVFGQNPVQYPRCHQDMKLKGFLLKTNLMFKGIQVLSRAPPLKEFLRYRNLQGQNKTISFETEEGWKTINLFSGPNISLEGGLVLIYSSSPHSLY